MQVTNWYLPVSWISIIVTQTWCDSVLWWFSGVIHGQKWAKNQPKMDIWVIFEVWKGRKMAKNGSFLRPEVWPTDQILAQKKSGPQKFKSSQKKLIPAQLGKFLGPKVGPFWPSDCLRGPPRKSKMQKIFRARGGQRPLRARKFFCIFDFRKGPLRPPEGQNWPTWDPKNFPNWAGIIFFGWI